MILFCVDQVAGAEYLLPLLRRWILQGRLGWHVCAGPRSMSVLQFHNIPVTAVGNDLASEARRLIADFRPRLVLMSASAESAIEAVFRHALREESIKCVQFIDMWVSYALRFRNLAGQTDLPDLLLTLDDGAKQAMVSEGIPKERIVVIGQPYFEERLREADQTRVAPTQGPTLLVTQPVSRYLGKCLGYDEIDFLEGVLLAWQQASYDWQQLHVIVHPDEDRQGYLNRLARYSASIRIVDNGSLKLSEYSLIIGMYSSLMIHALLSRVNTVSFQPRACGQDFCHLSAQGLIKRLTTVEELVHFLAKTGLAGQSDPFVTSTALLSAIQGSCDRLENFLLS